VRRKRSTACFWPPPAHPCSGGLGALANVTVTSYETIILDNERYGAIYRILRGVSSMSMTTPWQQLDPRPGRRQIVS